MLLNLRQTPTTCDDDDDDDDDDGNGDGDDDDDGDGDGDGDGGDGDGGHRSDNGTHSGPLVLISHRMPTRPYFLHPTRPCSTSPALEDTCSCISRSSSRPPSPPPPSTHPPASQRQHAVHPIPCTQRPPAVPPDGAHAHVCFFIESPSYTSGAERSHVPLPCAATLSGRALNRSALSCGVASRPVSRDCHRSRHPPCTLYPGPVEPLAHQPPAVNAQPPGHWLATSTTSYASAQTVSTTSYPSTNGMLGTSAEGGGGAGMVTGRATGMRRSADVTLR